LTSIANRKTTRPPVNQSHIQLKLFAGLAPFTPEDADRVPIEPGVSVEGVLQQLNIPSVKAHLIFINGVKRSLDARLDGGERVGIFPPVAGG
jgi:molybdopterin converting factor small subunit